MRRRLVRWSLWTCGPILVGALVLLLPLHAPIALVRHTVPAAQDSVTVAAGEHYGAGGVQLLLLGRHYRNVWQQPLKVEVLRLHEFEGGLTPLKEGGGQETRSLHFISAAGRRYIFRSTDKELVRLIHYGLAGSLLARLVQDQTCASHPASALVTAPLQEAVGLPTGHPRLVLLPSDDSLGVFQERFGGLMGTFQEAPAELGEAQADSNETDSGRSAGGPAVIDTDELLTLLNADGRQQIDARGFLTARLLDLFLNDWDRHGGQWRWMAKPESWGTVWRPIPVDRDQAFANYDGLLLSLARLRTTKLSAFRPSYPHLQGLTRNSGWLDSRFLAGISRGTWDSIVGFVVARLSDPVIDSAVRRMPPAYWEISGPALAETLKRRRDGLRAIAEEFYLQVASQAEVHLARTEEHIVLRYLEGGGVNVSVQIGGAGVTSFERQFIPSETSRIALRLHGPLPPLASAGRTEPKSIPVVALDSLGNEVALPLEVPKNRGG